MIIKFTIENLDLISTNKMYMPRPTRGGRSAYITKTNEYRNFESVINEKLLTLISKEDIKKLHEELDNDDQLALFVMYDFGMPKVDYFRNDVSNYIKTLEDSIKTRINIDDTRNCIVQGTKHIIPGKTWSTEVKMSTYHITKEIPEGCWSKKIIK